MTSWRARESETQTRSREDNESAARDRVGTSADGRMSSFQCECGDKDCTCAIQLTLAEYESVRAYATHFAIARNHENPEVEQLIEEHERFAVVETVSREAAKLARRSYPRQWRGRRSSPKSSPNGGLRRGVRAGGIELLNANWHELRSRPG
jgi:hypothetical protein